MNSPVARKLSLLGLALSFMVAVALSSVGYVFAACNPGDTSCTRTYLKGTGSDIGAGGWFNNGSNSCLSSGSFFQDSNYSPAGGGSSDNRYGGILSFANSSANNSNGGTSSEFAAFALGLIEGPTATVPNSGFYSGGSQAKNTAPTPSVSVGYTSFSNTANSPWGGLMVGQGQPRQASFCIPDYFSTKLPNPPPPPIDPGFGNNQLRNNTASGVYYENVGAGNIFALNGAPSGGPVVLDPGRRITIFVNGSVYIQNNINYGTTGNCVLPDAPSGLNGLNAECVTKLAVIARGNIYIDPNVSQLQGLYIAQPDPTDTIDPVGHDTGAIWTCHPFSTTLAPDAYATFFPQCKQNLIVNGAFVAKRIHLLRIAGGDVTAARTSEDGYRQPQISAYNSAEVINFSPDMVIGGSFFSPDNGATNANPKIDSLISLPPVF
jgi:hypothetical protein